MAVDKIRVEGLRELLSELRKVDSAFPKEMRAASKQVADKVAEGTRASFASRGGVAPKVVPSVKALASQRSAAVRIGGERYPYALGSEFGSVEHKQFPAWRGSGAGAGYSLYETLREQRDEIVDEYADAVERVVSKAFPTRR